MHSYKMGKTEVKPLGGRVLVLRDAPEEETDHGLLIPDNAMRPAESGVVLAVGRKRGKQSELDVGPGDAVVIPQFVGTEILVEGQWLTLMDREQIYGQVV